LKRRFVFLEALGSGASWPLPPPPPPLLLLWRRRERPRAAGAQPRARRPASWVTLSPVRAAGPLAGARNNGGRRAGPVSAAAKLDILGPADD